MLSENWLFEKIISNLRPFHTSFYAILILIVTFVSRFVLIAVIPETMYYYDSYLYFSQATSLMETGTFPAVDISYTLLLSSWISIFGWIYEKLLISRYLNIFLAAITAIILFNLSRRFSDEFAFTSTLLILFEPMFLSFSITTHNDIFALMSALVAISCALSNKKICFQFIAPLTLSIAVLAKPFLYIVLGFPFVCIYILRILKSAISREVKSLIILLIIAIFTLAPFSPIGQKYYYAQTRFDPLTKISIFLKPEIVLFVIEKVFSITNATYINFFMGGLFIMAILFIIYEYVTEIKKIGIIFYRNMKDFLPLLMLAFFFLSIFSLSVFTIPYEINEGVVFPILDVNSRYLIWPRMAILWLTVYALWKIVSTLCPHAILSFSISHKLKKNEG